MTSASSCSRLGELADVAGDDGEVAQRLGDQPPLPEGAGAGERRVERLAGRLVLALPGQPLAQPQSALRHEIAPTDRLGEFDRLERGRLLGAVLAVVERPPTARQQQSDAPFGIVLGDGRLERVEDGQIGLLRGPIADPVEHRLAREQQVEAEQRRRLGDQLDAQAEQPAGVGECVDRRCLLRRRPGTNGPPPPGRRCWRGGRRSARRTRPSDARTRPSSRTSGRRGGGSCADGGGASPRRRRRAAGRA